MLKKIVILFLIVSLFIVNEFTNLTIKSYIFAASLAVKDIILFILPFVIFFCVLNAFLKLGKNAMSLILFMLTSTFIFTFLVGTIVYPIGIFATFISNKSGHLVLENIDVLNPAFETGIEPLFPTIVSLISAIIVALIISFTIPNKIDYIRSKLEITTKYILNKVVIPIVPVFVYGFALKIIHEKILVILIQKLSLILLIYIVTTFTFILIIYFMVYRRKLFIKSLKEIFPSLIVAITTVSSNVAMPFLLNSIKNTIGKNNEEIIDAVTPPSVNFHLIGDCFLVNIFVIYIYSMYNNGELISFYPFLLINLYISLSRFMGVAIPGGGAFVVSPILEANFGFSSAMTALFTTVYMLLDFINTAANIMANGYYVTFISKFYTKFFR